ncbi:MAG: glycosyltransferase [Desulfobacterales bacterium]|nr:glycosyltransferase [Desulfobacterales bacterium]
MVEKDLRVLHVGKYYPPYQGGMENYLKDLLRALHREDVSVSALVHQHISGKSFSREIDGDLTVLRVPLWGQVLYTPISPSFPYFLKKSIKSFKPDIIHLHFPNPSIFWGLFISEMRSIPWLVQWHSDVVPSTIDRRLYLAYQCYRPFEQAVLKRAKKILATSQPYLEESIPLRRWSSKCCVVPLGLDPDRLPLPEEGPLKIAEQSWNSGAFRVLAVGRLTYYKGFEVLINAALQVPDISVRIVGDGALRKGLEREIIRKRLEGRVVLRGALSDPELQALLASCHCLCLPSIERTEAFGIVLLEAMRYGRTLVASDIPGSGVGWVVRKGSCGLLVPPGDVNALAAALRQLAEQRSLCRDLGQKGRAEFQKNFDIQYVARQIKEIYLRLETKIPSSGNP